MTLIKKRFWLAGLAVFALSACESGVSPEAMSIEGAPMRSEASAKPARMADAIVMEVPAPLPVMPARRSPRGKRGVVTAGDIDDTLNLAAFTRYQARAAKELKLPRVNLDGMVSARLVSATGAPAAGMAYTLTKMGAREPFHAGYSGVDGVITAFPAALGAGRPSSVMLKVFDGGVQVSGDELRTGNTGMSRLIVPTSGGWTPDFLDLTFVFDTTGSMGDELAWLTKEFQGIVREAKRAAPGVDIRFGLIAYRDDGDAYKVKTFGFTKSQPEMQRWLRGLDANGGGDYPEAAAEALEAAAAMQWRRGKGERIVFHIADAPAHSNKAKRFLAAASKAAGQNVQIFGLGASGVAKESEFLMRQAALVSGGRYLFLTDDSGVGNAHAEPTISCYRVSKLKDLLVRVLASELSGARQEASGGQVIREVGNYSRGVCSQ
ncbi:vWA domain-containing protein [Lentibacter sp.]|uniref:vWA domain-containing protein n=1 Tax=Lentibacter sp. TaxID=2024994 RepID=UPI003F6A3F5A